MDINEKDIMNCICSRKSNVWESPETQFQTINLRGIRKSGRIDCLDRLSCFGVKRLDNKSVLDIGCSIGACCVESKLIGADSVVGVDSDETSIRCAQMIAKYNEMDITYLMANLEDETALNQIQSINKHFDYIFCFAVMSWVAHSSLARILKEVSFNYCLMEVHEKCWNRPKNADLFINRYSLGCKSEFLGQSSERERNCWLFRR